MFVLLAETKSKVRSALRLLLESEGHSIIGEATDSQTLLHLLASLQSQILLLDWELPSQPIDEVVRAVKQKQPTLKIIALSSHPEAEQEAFNAGVDGFISKGHPAKHFLSSFHAIASHI